MKKVLDFIKAHTIALAFAAIALVAMAAFFLYVPSLFGDLQAKVDERKQVHDTLAGLESAQRTLPNVDVSAAEPKPLPVFPTDRVIKAGEEAMQRLTDQSNQVLTTITKMNQRPLLVPNSLPNPTRLARQNFLEAYKAISQQYGEGAKNSLITTKLKGVLPPSDAELRDIESSMVNQIMKQDLQIGGNGQPVNQPEVEAKIAERKAKLPLEQRVIRALNAQIYVSPGAVDVIPELMTTTDPPDVVTVFNAQYSLWVQSAVFEAIANANANSENVLTSPVKHLVRLDMPMMVVPGGGGQQGGFFGLGSQDPNVPAVPTEIKPDASAAFTPNYTRGPLGFASNSMFDPVPVMLTLRVDARRLPEILAALQGGQLLKVKNINYRTASKGRALQEGYVYDRDGTTPMVEILLDCDVLMLRSWIAPFMPDAAKAHFASLSNPPVPQ